MDDDGPITLRIANLQEINEKEYAQHRYDTAKREMLDRPCAETIANFAAANKNFFEVMDAYRIGGRLLEEFKRAHHHISPNPSQNLHGL